MCSPDEKTEQETLTDEEVRELYGTHPFVLLALKGGAKHRSKRLRRRYELLVIQKKMRKKQKTKLTEQAKKRIKAEEKLFRTYNNPAYLLRKKPRTQKL